MHEPRNDRKQTVKMCVYTRLVLINNYRSDEPVRLTKSAARAIGLTPRTPWGSTLCCCTDINEEGTETKELHSETTILTVLGWLYTLPTVSSI